MSDLANWLSHSKKFAFDDKVLPHFTLYVPVDITAWFAKRTYTRRTRIETVVPESGLV